MVTCVQVIRSLPGNGESVGFPPNLLGAASKRYTSHEEIVNARKPIAYVETSVISFYNEIRTEPSMVSRRDWTRLWWKTGRSKQTFVTSPAVLDELRQGEYPIQEECIRMAYQLPMLPVPPEITEIVEFYIRRQVMPNDPSGDALHLALASFHHCDFLVTWNCHHLANANKFGHIRRVNALLNLFVPTLITPLELLGEDYDDL
jgi:hypothetical protein